MKIPRRTCVGCRRVDDPSRGMMIRVVVEAGRAVIDERRRGHLPGRGAWVHRDRPCIESAVKGGLARSFRRKVDPRVLESSLASAAEKS